MKWISRVYAFFAFEYHLNIFYYCVCSKKKIKGCNKQISSSVSYKKSMNNKVLFLIVLAIFVLFIYKYYHI